MPKHSVGVGVGALVALKNDRSGALMILVGRRKGSHGAGTWALPGGWLDKGEEFAECGSRELREETGMIYPPSAFQVCPFVSNNVDMDGVHSVTVFVATQIVGDDAELARVATQPRVCEPDKCHEWKWVEAAEMESLVPAFPPLVNLIASEWFRSFVEGK